MIRHPKGSFSPQRTILRVFSLTAGPGMPLRPCGPDFPGCPWGPTGPIFPMRPSKPGAPWKQTALSVTTGRCGPLKVRRFCFSPLFLSNLPFLPCQVSPSDPEGHNLKTGFQPESVTGVQRCAQILKQQNKKIYFTPDKKHTNPSPRRSRRSRFSSCSRSSLKIKPRSCSDQQLPVKRNSIVDGGERLTAFPGSPVSPLTPGKPSTPWGDRKINVRNKDHHKHCQIFSFFEEKKKKRKEGLNAHIGSSFSLLSKVSSDTDWPLTDQGSSSTWCCYCFHPGDAREAGLFLPLCLWVHPHPGGPFFLEVQGLRQAQCLPSHPGHLFLPESKGEIQKWHL